MRASCRVLLSLAASAIAAEAIAASTAPKVKHTIIPPRGWVKRATPPPNHSITLRIGLPQPNFPVLEQHLYEVSDPNHRRYGVHLSKQEVEALVAPHDETVQIVDDWLASHGIEPNVVMRSSAKDWVILTVPIFLAEKMLDTTYNVWVHAESGEAIVRTTRYSLPEHLHEHIEVVQPTTIFAQFRRMRSTINWPPPDEGLSLKQNLATAFVETTSGLVDERCNSTITIRCLQQLYKTTDYVPTAANNSIAVTGYLEQYANEQDLRSFYLDQKPEAVNSTFEFFSVNGGLNNQSLPAAGAEANLDVQFAFGLAFPIMGTFYSTGGRPPFIPDYQTPTNTNEPYRDWLDFVLAQSSVPLVISTSYGEHEQTVPEDYARRVCADFAQLGARGVSILFSSGDFGVGDGNPNSTTQGCFTNDGRNVTRFLPSFPASCPFVTAVGGTQFINPEVAVSRYFSGGGFSDYFSRPQYQDQAVRQYLDALPQGLYEGLYNQSGRGFPDVAAQGDRFRIWLSGRPILIGGTSASSPAFAAIVALLNDVRLANLQPPLGFLNPLLYSKATQDFNDITIGHNSGCGTLGFNATKGWDPVTGLGTPNFEKLKATILKG